MLGTPDGRIKSIHEGGATLPNDLDDEVEEDAGALPRMQVEQLRRSTRSSRMHDSNMSRNAQSSSERSSTIEMVCVRASWPAT